MWAELSYPSILDLWNSPASCPFPEHFDLLCRTDREVALRAAARYIDLLLHHLVNVHVCAFSLILLLQKGHRCSAGYLRNQWLINLLFQIEKSQTGSLWTRHLLFGTSAENPGAHDLSLTLHSTSLIKILTMPMPPRACRERAALTLPSPLLAPNS